MSGPPSRINKHALAMFKHYTEGKSQRDIAKLYGVSHVVVNRIAKRDEWKKMLLLYVQRAYDEAITVGAKRAGADTLNILASWVNKIAKRINEGGDATIEEIKEVQKIFAKLAEENRLNDNKPTQITSGEVRHIIHLPPNVRRFGVDPPGPGVIEVESTPASEAAKKEGIDLDDLDD